MPPPQQPSLVDLGRKLVGEGPSRTEPTNRRIRGQLNGLWAFDTLEAVYVWEHPFYPYFYIPLRAIEAGPGEVRRAEEGIGFWVGKLLCEGGAIPAREADVLVLTQGPLTGFVKIPVVETAHLTPLDAWYAEDERLLGPHPKDPYKRVECLPSTREVRIEFAGRSVARCTSSVFLHETGLRVRHYLAPTAVLDWGQLRPSETVTYCPYKGQARYYDLEVEGEGDEGRTVERDAVWCYEYPTAEAQAIKGLLCFYNEKVDVFVDGVKEGEQRAA